MNLISDLGQMLANMLRRIEVLEKTSQIKKVKIPSGGKFVIDSYTSDPPSETARIYYNTTSHKLKVNENGTWKTVTTT